MCKKSSAIPRHSDHLLLLIPLTKHQKWWSQHQKMCTRHRIFLINQVLRTSYFWDSLILISILLQKFSLCRKKTFCTAHFAFPSKFESTTYSVAYLVRLQWSCPAERLRHSWLKISSRTYVTLSIDLVACHKSTQSYQKESNKI